MCTVPLLHFHITPRILVQYQQFSVHRIAIQSALNNTPDFVKNFEDRLPAEFFSVTPAVEASNCMHVNSETPASVTKF